MGVVEERGKEERERSRGECCEGHKCPLQDREVHVLQSMASSLSSAASSSGGSVLLADKCHFTTETAVVPLPHSYTYGLIVATTA